VLVINPYYRVTTAPIDIDWESLSDPGSDWNEDLFNTVMGLWKAVTPEMTKTDAIAFAAYLDRQKPVDPKRKMGTAGYCMGGPEVLRTAAALPDRVGALASFHGGYMVTPEPSSPHWLVPKTSAQAIIAIGANDDKDNPNEKSVYREAYEKAKLPAEIEVYGAMHSWCIPDSKAYHPAQSDRAWSRLLALFERALI
jgi:carboxymethylenebutenolidase